MDDKSHIDLFEEVVPDDEELQVKNPVVDLETFREQWKLELGLQPPPSTNTSSVTSLKSEGQAKQKNEGQTDAGSGSRSGSGSPRRGSDEQKAKEQHQDVISSDQLVTEDKIDDVDDAAVVEEAHALFLQAVQHEKTGNFYDAIRFYKKALTLVPDIEHRVCQHQQKVQLEKEHRRSLLADSRARLKEKKSKSNQTGIDSLDVDSDDDEVDLKTKFMLEIEENNWLWFEKFRRDEKAHFQHCPEEVVKYILRWIVSRNLDVRSLDVLSNVSKGFYVLCRDDKLWKDVCERIWGQVSTMAGRQSDFSSYREMFLTRSHVRFDGCYISKITYIRSGENSFQDSSYRPWQMVEYYRYIYFTPQGQFFFLTTSELPVVTVPHLRDPLNQTKFNNILVGHYTLEGNSIHGQCWNPNKIKVNNSRSNNSGFGNINYNLVLQVLHLKKKFNNGLLWLEYFVNIENNNHVLKNDFTIEQLKFPNFFYSRVKSFTRDSQSVLT